MQYLGTAGSSMKRPGFGSRCTINTLKLPVSRAQTAPGKTRPTLVLVVDVRGWAFDNIACNIGPLLADKFQIKVVYYEDFPSAAALMLHCIMELQPDHLHFFWRETPMNQFANPRPLVRLARASQIDPATLAASVGRTVLTSCVRDHLFLEDKDIKARQERIGLLDAYAACSLKLFDIYTEKYTFKPTVEIMNGVDTGLFVPKNLSRFKRPRRRSLRIGWVGNSAWGQQSADSDHKGSRSILMPALEQLGHEGFNLQAVFADRQVQHRPIAQMPDYYADIDILVCVSKSEGTPNPLLEAMACGVPIVTTDVGIAREIFGPLQSAFILPDRSIASLQHALRKLIEAPSDLGSLSAENLVQVQNHQWHTRIPGWLRLWKVGAQTNLERRSEKYALLLRRFNRADHNKASGAGQHGAGVR